MHARRGFKPERFSTLVSLSRRGSLLVAVATHSTLPDPAARLAAPASEARIPDERDERASAPRRRYMTRSARIPLRDAPCGWRRRNRVSGFGKSWGVLCLSSSTTLKAGSVAPQATIRRSAAEEEKCRLTGSRQHAKRLTPSGREQQNADAHISGRTRALL